MAFGYYETLGLGQGASDEELRRGYYRSIKKHPPEKDPEGYKRVVAAYETLSDPKARAEYDALQAHGGEIEQLMKSVSVHEGRSQWSEAIRLLKRVVLLAPSLEEPQNRLGLNFLHDEKYQDAVKVFEKLTASTGATPLYWRHLGLALRYWAAQLEDGSTRQGEILSRAIAAFETAHKLEPLNLKDFLEIARCHLDGSNYRLARSWAERAVSETLDLTTLEALLFLARVDIYERDTSGLDRVARRLCQVTPADNEDLRAHVAGRLAELAHEVCEAGKKYQNEALFRPAAILLDHATSLNRENGDLKEFAVLVSNVADALDDYDRFKEDTSINGALRQYGVYFLAEAIGHDVNSWEWSYKDAIGQLDGLTDRQVLAALRTFKSKYPAIYWLGDTLLKEIEEHIIASEREATAKKEREQQAAEERRKREREAEEKQRERERRLAEDRRRQAALQAQEEQRRRQEEEARHQEAVARERALRLERHLRRKAWWRRYGWLVALVSVACVVLLAPVVKKEFLRQQAERAARLEREAAEERQRTIERQEALARQLKAQRAEARALAARVRKAGFRSKGQVVFDTRTGLTWMRDNPISQQTMTWDQAMAEARSMNYGGYNDWRLPTREELEQMARKGGARPAEFFQKVGFPYVAAETFWTSTEHGSIQGDAWGVRMIDGMSDFGSKDSALHTWFVRGGNAAVPTPEAAQAEIKPAVAREGEPVATADEPALTGSEARQMVARFLRATDAHDLAGVMSLYADRVNYFAWGNVPKSEVRKDKASHFKRWRESRSDLNGSVIVAEVPGFPDRKRVTFEFNFFVDSDKKSVNGMAANTWILQKAGETLKIVDEKQSILQRDTHNH